MDASHNEYGKLEERCLPEFRRLLTEPLLQEVEQHEGSVYGLLSDFRLAYHNPAWVFFARENGAAPKVWSGQYLGTSVLDVTAAELQPFYRKLFSVALASPADRFRPLQHRYQCHSAEQYREFLMSLYAVGEAQGLLIVNSSLVEVPYDPREAVAVEGRESVYIDQNGLIHQCAHCRRVENLAIAARWDWVPAWVERVPPRTSHTICHVCMAYFYPLPDSPD